MGPHRRGSKTGPLGVLSAQPAGRPQPREGGCGQEPRRVNGMGPRPEGCECQGWSKEKGVEMGQFRGASEMLQGGRPLPPPIGSILRGNELPTKGGG